MTIEQLTDLLKRHKHKGDLTTVLLDYLIRTSPDYNQGDTFYVDSNRTIQRLSAGTSGDFLKTQGASANPIWATISSTLDGLSDVVITTPATGATLVYDGVNWIDSQSPTLVEIKGDTGALPVISFTGITNGLRNIRFTNAISGGKALLKGAGDVNVPILLQGKGTGQVHLGDAELAFPDADGNANEILETDGSGSLSFRTAPVESKWEHIETITVAGAAVSSVEFSSISTDYTAFRLTCMYKSDQSTVDGNCWMRFNSDTANNYSYSIDTNSSTSDTPTAGGIRLTLGTLGNNRIAIINVKIQNLTAADDKSLTWDTAIMPAAVGTAPDLVSGAGYWDNNAKITTITIFPGGTGVGDKIVVGSKFVLEGIK